MYVRVYIYVSVIAVLQNFVGVRPIYICMYVCIYIYVCMYVCMYIYICIYIYMYIHMYTCSYIYIHTHTGYRSCEIAPRITRA